MMWPRRSPRAVLGAAVITACLGATVARAQSGTGAAGTPGGDGADRRPVILAIGESTTAGYGVPADGSYPAQLQQALAARGYRYRVVNHGVSGSTTFQALARLDRGVSLQPEIVLIALGGNDNGSRIPPATTGANLARMISLFKRVNATVFVADRALGRGEAPVVADVAREHGAVLMPPLLTGVADNPDLLIGDGRHPNAEGYRVIVSRLIALIEPHLRKH